jgi:hypothetical protein
MGRDLLARGEWTPYRQGQRPDFATAAPLRWMEGTPLEEAARRAD